MSKIFFIKYLLISFSKLGIFSIKFANSCLIILVHGLFSSLFVSLTDFSDRRDWHFGWRRWRRRRVGLEWMLRRANVRKRGPMMLLKRLLDLSGSSCGNTGSWNWRGTKGGRWAGCWMRWSCWQLVGSLASGERNTAVDRADVRVERGLLRVLFVANCALEVW